MYNIVRFYHNHPNGTVRQVIESRVTLEDAQAHCKDPETSSSTCTGQIGRRRTQQVGDWFDGYEER